MLFRIILLILTTAVATQAADCENPPKCNSIGSCYMGECEGGGMHVADRCLSCCPYCPSEEERKATGDDVPHDADAEPTAKEAYQATKLLIQWTWQNWESKIGNYDDFYAMLNKIKRFAYRKIVTSARKDNKQL